jgi:hypothetical protein
MEWMPRTTGAHGRPERRKLGRGRAILAAVIAIGLLPVPISHALQLDASAASRKRVVRKSAKSTKPVKLRAPRLQKPANGAKHLQALPTFEWATVAHASAYQFQLSADKRFRSLVRTEFGNRAIETTNIAATADKAVPDGTYYWRVRAVAGKTSTGPWSAARSLGKEWTSVPDLGEPTGTTVYWPSQPLVFHWSSVPYAAKYQLTVATDPSLAGPVIGTRTSPVSTTGTAYTPSAPLDSGTYFWAVTPIDAEGHQGRRSEVGSFALTWPSSTTPTVSDPEFGPLFRWAPVPGAARYEVEANSAGGFPAGSKWCCSGTTVGTSFAPTKVVGNNVDYWRVRALDAKGHAGVWNEGPPFSKAVNSVEQSSLTVVRTEENAHEAVPTTHTPIVTWNPVPGASLYQVQLAPYSASGCDWSATHNAPTRYQAETASTGWTPLAQAPSSKNRVGPPAWPTAQTANPLPAGEYCVQVSARADNDARDKEVVSVPTQLNGDGNPAFIYSGPPNETGPPGPLETPASSYIQPVGSTTPRTPFFTWRPVVNAHGYFVVIARDEGFTNVVDVGFTNVPAYAPRLANQEPLSDETTAYYWAVIPTETATGGGVFYGDPGHGQDSPQAFNKDSVPPSPLSPAPGSKVSAQPTFEWTNVENARSYRLQVATDPSFSHPLEDVTTDATAYTSTTTYPADATLYWRVRGNDWIGQGLNWSPTQMFERTLPKPSLGSLAGGELMPVLGWSEVEGAVGYEVHVTRVNGVSSTYSFPAAAAAPTEWYGLGTWNWQVRADFPGARQGQTITGGYSQTRGFVRTMSAPPGAHGVKSGARIVVSWNPGAVAKRYQVQFSTTDSFARLLESHQTDNASWAPLVKLSAADKRGPLYWRVAAVDASGNVGSYASGRFAPPKAKHHAKKRRSTKRRSSRKK